MKLKKKELYTKMLIKFKLNGSLEQLLNIFLSLPHKYILL